MTAPAVGVPSGEAGPPRPVKVRTRPAASLLEPAILRRAALRAFVKLDPRLMIEISVMFVGRSCCRTASSTSGATLAAFLAGVIVIVGGLIYFPMLILGPIGERIIG
ncbi:MAG TPA: potassium-transporting ATPase subunit KdpA [Trebonia sp.]|nr:potassium-transporting ATPase subunit KdpA [Trebonia sp.]